MTRVVVVGDLAVDVLVTFAEKLRLLLVDDDVEPSRSVPDAGHSP